MGTDYKGLTLTINSCYHKRNRVLKIKKLEDDSRQLLASKCDKAVSSTTTAGELYKKWLSILREIYGSMPRNNSILQAKPDEDLVTLGLCSFVQEAPWPCLKRDNPRLPTEAKKWTVHLKDLYNEEVSSGPVSCPQKAQGAHILDSFTIAGAIQS